MRYCVDASAVLARLIRDQSTPSVMQFWMNLSRDDEVVAPYLLLPECTSVLRTKAFEGSLMHLEAMDLVADLLALPIRVSDNRGQFHTAVEKANRTRRKKAYDMQYVAVAVMENCAMVTLDGGVYQAAREQRITARLLR